MDAREIIEDVLKAFTHSATAATNVILADLTAAGYQIIHRDENHGPTLERIAKASDKRAAMADQVSHEAAIAMLLAFPSALRAMEVKHHG